MRTVKISELKAKLSAHIELVKNGEEVLIFNRDKLVARLVPGGDLDAYDELEQRLIASGQMTPPSDPRNLKGFIPKPAGNKMIPQEVIDRLWEEERADRC